MEASVRIFNPTNISRTILIKQSLKLPPKHSSQMSLVPSRNPNNLIIGNSSASFAVSRSSVPPPISNPLGFLLSLSATQIFNSRVSDERLDRVGFDSKEKYFSWNRATEGINGGDLRVLREKGPVFTVVMLGWLGAEQNHLKRYIEMYTSRGIQAVSFVVPVKDMLGFDLGTRVEKRIEALGEELVIWLSETEEDGRERFLLFHTFSNTGWLAYGAILDYLQSRGDFMGKVQGCVIDSGGDPEIDPQVWAAGFSAALLKKRSSAILPSVEAIEGNELETDKDISKVQDTEPLLIETLLLSVLEKFFSFVLNLPDVNRRLSKVISILKENQPPCPQLYLYSTADKVIPFRRVELFIQDQKMKGRKVQAYNFGLSPHVDHYRKFPHVYSAELHTFLKECMAQLA